MTKFVGLLILHVVLLVLAVTQLTIVTGLSSGRYEWEYFRYFSQSGWGGTYQFPYSLPVVLLYLAAYGTGAAAYLVAYLSRLVIIGLLGMAVCTVGFASFALELSHWFVDHQRSWIASAPIVLLALALAAVVQMYLHRTAERRNKQPQRSVAAVPKPS